MKESLEAVLGKILSYGLEFGIEVERKVIEREKARFKPSLVTCGFSGIKLNFPMPVEIKTIHPLVICERGELRKLEGAANSWDSWASLLYIQVYRELFELKGLGLVKSLDEPKEGLREYKELEREVRLSLGETTRENLEYLLDRVKILDKELKGRQGGISFRDRVGKAKDKVTLRDIIPVFQITEGTKLSKVNLWAKTSLESIDTFLANKEGKLLQEEIVEVKERLGENKKTKSEKDIARDNRALINYVNINMQIDCPVWSRDWGICLEQALKGELPVGVVKELKKMLVTYLPTYTSIQRGIADSVLDKIDSILVSTFFFADFELIEVEGLEEDEKEMIREARQNQLDKEVIQRDKIVESKATANNWLLSLAMGKKD